MTDRDIFIENVKKYNKDNKYNISDFFLYGEESEFLYIPNDDIKKQVHFSVWDNSMTDLPDGICVFQSSIDRSSRKSTQFPMPYPFSKIDEKFELITETPPSKPSIGFCGFYFVNEIRRDTLYHLKRDKRLNTDFIWRASYQAKSDNISQDDARIEFIENMRNNAFNVCVRGNGNYSFRFYEALSCGRIPVLLDTDTILPFDDVIDYSEFCIITNTADELSEAILNKWNDGSYIEMQKKAYEVYYEYFDINIVGKRIIEYLDRNYEKKL